VTVRRAKSGSPTASVLPALAFGVGLHSSSVQHSGELEAVLQYLIASFFETHPDEAFALRRVFIALARELGRIDGAARMKGITRDETLELLRESMLNGKVSMLAQHEKGCDCEPAKVLQAEVEVN
jgi:hypothetical protein